MKRNRKIYNLTQVDKYLAGLWEEYEIVDMDVIDGSLIDTYIIYHNAELVEVFEEVYLNEWSSGYVRHIYRKGLPKRFGEMLAEQERREAEEIARAEIIQSGVIDATQM